MWWLEVTVGSKADNYSTTISKAHGPLARYVKLRVAHALGMLGTFSPPPRLSDPDMHHGTCAMHGARYMPGSLPSGFLWSRWRGKRSRHSRRMRNPQFYVSGKRPILCTRTNVIILSHSNINTIFVAVGIYWFKAEGDLWHGPSVSRQRGMSSPRPR